MARVARRSKLTRVVREIGVVGERPATREGAEEFRQALEELGTTYVKLGQLLSSRPDLLPDVYIEELGKLVDEVPPVPFEQIRQVIAEDLPPDVFVRIDPEPLATAIITTNVPSATPAALRPRVSNIGILLEVRATIARSDREACRKLSQIYKEVVIG